MRNAFPDVYICPLRKKRCTSSSCVDSKIYTSGSIASSQTMLTEINESGAIAKK